MPAVFNLTALLPGLVEEVVARVLFPTLLLFKCFGIAQFERASVLRLRSFGEFLSTLAMGLLHEVVAVDYCRVVEKLFVRLEDVLPKRFGGQSR